MRRLMATLLFMAPLAAQEPSFRSGPSELVVLPVIVTDRQGRYVGDLPRDRFTVYDNGRRVAIELFSNEDTPVTVGLLIDASGSMRSKLAEVVAGSLAFAKSSNPQDELFAIRFNDDVQHAVRDRRFLMAGDLGALQSALVALRADGRTALYDALTEGLDHLALGSRPRKVLLVISDGGDNASQATLERVLSRARQDLDRNTGVLKSLAHTTGGERFLPHSPGELLRVCERIAREIRSGYTIGYVPPDRDGAYHRVRVQIEPSPPRRSTVRTRPGYFAAGRSSQP
ncbi:MAG: VWA domain-containing protein [Acidobacteria bacterium]|nr:MAG: VWA domain-containing protein [Acidobacteriota bacterium]